MKKKFVQLTTLKDLDGKTIEVSYSNGNYVVLGFTDKSYCVLMSLRDIDSAVIEVQEVNTLDNDEPRFYLRDLGWITEDEFNKRTEKVMERWYKRQEDSEREEYSRLKKKFVQLTTLKDLDGKTIEVSYSNGNYVVLGFTDKSYCVLMSLRDIDSAVIEVQEVNTLDNDEPRFYLRDLGWITEDEFNKRTEKVMERWYKRQEDSEREEYSRLKKKFEN